MIEKLNSAELPNYINFHHLFSLYIFNTAIQLYMRNAFSNAYLGHDVIDILLKHHTFIFCTVSRLTYPISHIFRSGS